MESSVATFVIQIPTQTEDTAKIGLSELRGVVEHVGSGARQPFADAPELLAFLRVDRRCLSKEVER
jgi:hypothetical protein